MIVVGDARQIPLKDDSVDLVVTSPPYDDMKEYDSVCQWNDNVWKGILCELYRVMKPGGVVVWVVGDRTKAGSESGTSFKQALYAKDVVGFNLWDTMIYGKTGFSYPSTVRYHQSFEYMFVFSKGKPKTFNPIKDRKNKYVGIHGGERSYRGEYGMRTNIWFYNTGGNQTSKHKNTFKHPAPFPGQLALDHILTWTNEHDLVLDPMIGSGTTAVAAKIANRRFFGLDLSEEYVRMSLKRVDSTEL